jgi:hypothetical protein
MTALTAVEEPGQELKHTTSPQLEVYLCPNTLS